MKTHFLPTLPHGLGLGGGKGLPFFVSPLDHHSPSTTSWLTTPPGISHPGLRPWSKKRRQAPGGACCRPDP